MLPARPRKERGKRYPTPSSEPEEGDEDPLALKSLELASMETPMAHQVTLDSGAATSCIPVDLAATLGYKPIQPDGASKVYKTASGETVKDLGKIDAKVTIGIGNGALKGQGRCSFRVMAVSKPLLSAGALADKGWSIQMSKTGGHIAQDGKKIPISFCNGVYSAPIVFHHFTRRRCGVSPVVDEEASADFEAAEAEPGDEIPPELKINAPVCPTRKELEEHVCFTFSFSFLV